MSDEYCFSEKCQYRHWRSGSMPTHRKGDGCPKPHTPTTGEVEAGYAYNEWDTDAAEEAPRREEFRRWLAQVKAEALRDAADALEAVTVHWSNDGENTRAAWLRRRADQEEGACHDRTQPR